MFRNQVISILLMQPIVNAKVHLLSNNVFRILFLNVVGDVYLLKEFIFVNKPYDARIKMFWFLLL